jgi:hypothetical protein
MIFIVALCRVINVGWRVTVVAGWRVIVRRIYMWSIITVAMWGFFRRILALCRVTTVVWRVDTMAFWRIHGRISTLGMGVTARGRSKTMGRFDISTADDDA